MAIFFDLIERIINAVYLTPNPQVQTYFRDLRVNPSDPVAEDDDSKYRYTPEPNGEATSSATVGTIPGGAAQSKLSARTSGAN